MENHNGLYTINVDLHPSFNRNRLINIVSIIFFSVSVALGVLKGGS